MAQAFNKLGGIFPKGSGKGLAGGAGALITLGAIGYGLNASLFNGNKQVHQLFLILPLSLDNVLVSADPLDPGIFEPAFSSRVLAHVDQKDWKAQDSSLDPLVWRRQHVRKK